MKIRIGSLVHCITLVNSEMIGVVIDMDMDTHSIPIVTVVPVDYYRFNAYEYVSYPELEKLNKWLILKSNIIQVIEY